MAITISND